MTNSVNTTKKGTAHQGGSTCCSCVVCFNSLGINSRMEIYSFLKEKGKSTVSDVVAYVKLTQPTVSYHLKEMREAGILLSEKVGKEVYYYISGQCPQFGIDCVLKDVKFPGSSIK